MKATFTNINDSETPQRKSARVEFLNTGRTASQAATAGRRNDARKEFLQVVHARMDEHGEDYDTAYKACQRSHVEMANAVDNVPEPSTSEKCGILLMNVADQEEVDAAWTANKDKYPVDAPAVMKALIAYWQKKDSSTAEAAKAKVEARHPRLRALASYSPK